MKKYLIVIMLFALGLSACSSGKTAVPTEAPEAETTAIPAHPVLPTEISEEKTVPAAGTTADEGSGTAVQQAEAAISELDAAGERMDSRDSLYNNTFVRGYHLHNQVNVQTSS